MPTLRLVLVDDSREFLSVVQNYLEQQAHLQIIGLAGGGEEALQLAAHLQPDMILLDLAMPNLGGLEVTRRLKLDFPAIRVIILTLHDLPEYRQAAASAGADGFVSKAQLYDQLLSVIEDARSGGCRHDDRAGRLPTEGRGASEVEEDHRR